MNTNVVDITDVVMKDTTRAVTISDDGVIRIWDLTRKPDEESDNEDDDVFKQVEEESDKEESKEVSDKEIPSPYLTIR